MVPVSRTRTPRKVGTTAASLRARIDAINAKVAEVQKAREHVLRLISIAETNTTIGKPVSDRIHDLLRANPDVAFTIPEIMECTHVTDVHIEAVRKALQRLTGRQLLERVGNAYRYNAPPSGGPVP